jgi:hypothetical protein
MLVTAALVAQYGAQLIAPNWPKTLAAETWVIINMTYTKQVVWERGREKEVRTISKEAH